MTKMLSALLEEKPICSILIKKVEDYFRDEEHRRQFEEWYRKKYGKDQQCGDVKDGDVDPVWGFAEYAVIGVKQHWDQNQSQKNLCQLDTPVVFLILEKQSLNQRKK